MTAISKERMKIMNRRMMMSVMTLGLLLGLAPVSQGQAVEGCTSASFSQPGPPVSAGDRPFSVAVGDFNLDGKPDLATANSRSNNVTILLNTCSSTLPTDPPPTPATPVVVDIKPGKARNRINLFGPKSWRAVPVAILTTETFDATTVNPRSVRFGPRGAKDTDGHGRLVDANGDGKPDLVLRFRTRQTGIGCGESSASLTGKTLSGQAIQGTDAIRTVGCNDEEDEDEDE
jgi:FG-GAP repeat